MRRSKKDMEKVQPTYEEPAQYKSEEVVSLFLSNPAALNLLLLSKSLYC
jgi:hypothetical protein